MKYAYLGKSNMQVSRICLGTMHRTHRGRLKRLEHGPHCHVPHGSRADLDRLLPHPLNPQTSREGVEPVDPGRLLDSAPAIAPALHGLHPGMWDRPCTGGRGAVVALLLRGRRIPHRYWTRLDLHRSSPAHDGHGGLGGQIEPGSPPVRPNLR